MARRFIVAVVTLTLLWTGTLLHDIFSDANHGHDHFVASASHSNFFEHQDHHHDGDEDHLAGAQISDSESATDGGHHCHGPSAITTIEVSVNGSYDSQPVLLPLIGHWNNHVELLTVSNFSRPPPLTSRQFQTRLYLVNRTLLI